MVRLGPDGFLPDPSTAWGQAHNPDALPIIDLWVRRCVVLLGEPGTGKSTSFDERRRTVLRTAAADDQVLWLDLITVDSPAAFTALVAEPLQAALQQTAGTVELLLDGWDEPTARGDRLQGLLLAMLRTSDLDRVRLRISSRSGHWPHASLGRELSALFGSGEVALVELAALRSVDVAAIADAMGVNSDSFLQELRQRAVGELAARPLTAKALIARYKREGALPESRWDLFEGACLDLADEWDRARLEQRRELPPRADEVVDVVSAASALLLLSGHRAVGLGVAYATEEPDGAWMALDDLVDSVAIAMGRADTDEVRRLLQHSLRTGLFSGVANGFTWSHLSFGEFLAARFLAGARLPAERLEQLLGAPDELGGLAPQAEGIASWLASKSPGALALLVRRSPGLVLRADLASVEPDGRAAAVEGLLRAFEDGRGLEEASDHGHRAYRSLKHPGLADQLRHWVDADHRDHTRVETIEIAEATGTTELVPEILDIAADADAGDRLRAVAAHASGRLGSDDERRRLLPLLDLPSEEDPSDEVFGSVLRVVWPMCLGATDLVQHLRRPKRYSFFGAYFGFVSRDLVGRAGEDDLPHLLGWTRDHIGLIAEPWWNKYFDGLLERGTSAIDVAGVAEPLAVVWWNAKERSTRPRTNSHRLAIDDLLGRRRDLRQRFLLSIARSELKRGERGPDPGLAEAPLFLPEDAADLVEAVVSEPDEATARFLAGVANWAARQTHRPGYVEMLDVLVPAAESPGPLRDELAALFAAVPLDSPQAARDRERWARVEELWRERDERDAAASAEPGLDLDRCLAPLSEVEEGAPWRWGAFLHGLDGAPEHWHPPEDLSATDGWAQLRPADRERSLGAATAYLGAMHGEGGPDRPVPIRTGHARLGASTFLLLQREAPPALRGLPVACWRRWYGVLLDSAPPSGSEDVLAVAWELDPAGVRDALFGILDVGDATDGAAALRRVSGLLEYGLGGDLLERLRSSTIPEGQVLGVLRALLAARHEGAAEFATALLASLDESGSEDDAARVFALLLTYGVAHRWESLRRVIAERPERAAEGALEAAIRDLRHEGPPYWANASADVLADAHLWLSSAFPSAKDPRFDGAHSVGPREAIGEFRDRLLRKLEARGDADAIRALERVAAALPDPTTLRWRIEKASRAAREKAWRPLEPNQLARLISDPRTRVVDSEAALVDAVIASMRAFEDACWGERPTLRRYWDRVGGSEWKPTEEPFLMQELGRHVEDELRATVVNLEVEVRRRPGAGLGESVDAEIVGLLGEVEQGRVRVEAKGCWNDKLLCALEDQLVGQYLRPGGRRTGIYVVFWFDLDGWTATGDSRRPSPTRGTKEELIRMLDEQAEAMKTEGFDVRAVVLDLSRPRPRESERSR